VPSASVACRYRCWILNSPRKLTVCARKGHDPVVKAKVARKLGTVRRGVGCALCDSTRPTLTRTESASKHPTSRRGAANARAQAGYTVVTGEGATERAAECQTRGAPVLAGRAGCCPRADRLLQADQRNYETLGNSLTHLHTPPDPAIQRGSAPRSPVPDNYRLRIRAPGTASGSFRQTLRRSASSLRELSHSYSGLKDGWLFTWPRARTHAEEVTHPARRSRTGDALRPSQVF